MTHVMDVKGYQHEQAAVKHTGVREAARGQIGNISNMEDFAYPANEAVEARSAR